MGISLNRTAHRARASGRDRARSRSTWTGSWRAPSPAEDDESAPWAAPPSRRRTEPPIVGELPGSLELILGNEIYIAKDRLAPGLRNRLMRVAAFQNPEFYKT